jgi:hypothetical protein
MTLNELTNADAIEVVREEAREVVWEATRQQILDLIDQGLTSEQLKQALQL